MTRIPGTSVILLAFIGLFTSAGAQQGSEPASDEELKQNFAAEHEIGRRFQIDPNNLPAPKTGPIVTNRSLIDRLRWPGVRLPAITPQSIVRLN